MKLTLFRLTILFCLATVFVACEKEPAIKTTVYGRVVTYGTSDYPSDTLLPVELVETTGGSGLGVGEIVRQTKYTDDLGNFSFSFTAGNRQDLFWVRVPHTHTPPMHYDMSTHGGFNVPVGKVSNVNIVLKPVAWIELHVRNVNPKPGDILFVNWGGFPPEFHGMADDTVILSGGGNSNIPISLTLYRDGNWNNFKDTVFLPAFDTTYHLLEY